MPAVQKLLFGLYQIFLRWMSSMIFKVINRDEIIPVGSIGTAYLRVDFWDDWSSYRTQFQLTVYDDQGQQHRVGSVKIGHIGLQPGNQVSPNTRAPVLENEFQELPEDYFSLGQGETYYETLNTLPGNLRLFLLKGLRDVAYDLELLESLENEEVLSSSLLRDYTLSNIKNRFHRLATGNAELTAFQFEYVFPIRSTPANVPPPPPTLSFLVTPNSLPPSNVHVLIGRNGVGKTTCMQNIGRALLNVEDAENPPGRINQLGDNLEDWSFAGLVSVSFSAFDDFDLPTTTNQGIVAHRVGLRYRSEDDQVKIKTPEQLAEDFTRSFESCRSGLRAERWLKAVRTLANDPLFEDADVPRLLEFEEVGWEERSKDFYSRLSSGHKIVLLTITLLVELVDERTLVLIDEPEGHLHPPLLSAFIRSLADLLIQRNGVAIIATHSPVVLQEVPRSCVWMLRRLGSRSIAEQPTLETFGQNVGVLTREVFGLEVTTAGFHKLLADAIINNQLSYEGLLQHFNGELGAEGRAIARSLIVNRDSGV